MRAKASLIAKTTLLVLLTVSAGCKPKPATQTTAAEPAPTSPATNALRAQIDAKLAAIRQAGYPVTLEEMIRWLPVVPDAENRALLLTNAFAAYVYVKDVPDIPSRDVRLPSLTKRWFQYDVATNQIALQRLREASKLNRSRYPVDWTRGWDTDIPHLTKAKSAAQVLQREAALHVENRRPDMAVDSITTINSLARSLDQDPCLVSQLVRAVILHYAHQSTERLVNQTRPTDARLRTLQEMFHGNQEREPFTRALVSERCFSLDLFQQSREKFVALLEMLFKWTSQTNNIEAMAGAFVVNKDADCLFYLEAVERLIAASQLSDSRQAVAIAKTVEAQLRAVASEPAEKRWVVSTFLVLEVPHAEPPDGSLVNGPVAWFAKQMRTIALMRTAETALAVERYRLANKGQLPSDLNALTPEFLSVVPIDPFDGRPLRYSRLAKGYVVYSIGVDGQDNGGKESERASKAGEDGTDITFTVER